MRLMQAQYNLLGLPRSIGSQTSAASDMTRNITVGGIIQDPYWRSCAETALHDKYCDPGFEAEFFKFILETAHFTVHLKFYETPGKALKATINKEVDLTCSLALYGGIEFMQELQAIALVADSPLFITKRQSASLATWLMFKICEWDVWLLLFGLCMLVTAFNYICRFSLLTKWSHSNRFTQMFFALMLGIFLGLYSGYLALALGRSPQIPKLFNDLQQLHYLVEQKKCKLVALESNLLPHLFDTTLHKYKNDIHFVGASKFDNLYDEVLTSYQCKIGIDYKSHAYYMNKKMNKLTAILLPNMHETYASFFRTDHPHAEDISAAFSRGSTEDLYWAFAAKYAKKNELSLDSTDYEWYNKEPADNSVSDTTLLQIADVFWILLCGNLTGAIVLAYELMYKRFSTH